MPKRTNIDPDSLVFTEEKPPAPTFGTGERKSPYAAMVAQLIAHPGKWAKSAGNARKAEKLHYQFAGIERRTNGEDLWLRFVTADIIATEVIDEYAQAASGNLSDKEYNRLKDLVRSAAQEAGEKSEETKDGKTVKTQFFATDMFDAARTALRAAAVTS